MSSELVFSELVFSELASSELLAGALACLVFFLVLRLLVGRPEPIAAAPDGTALARRYVDERIEAHLGSLAALYLRAQNEPPRSPAHRTADDRFAPGVEAFIGEVLERDEADPRPERGAPDVSVRELLVLEREYVYRRIAERVREHLAAAS